MSGPTRHLTLRDSDVLFSPDVLTVHLDEGDGHANACIDRLGVGSLCSGLDWDDNGCCSMSP